MRSRALGDRSPAHGIVEAFASAPLTALAATIVTACLYAAAAKAGLSVAAVAEQVSVVWPPTGIALALVLLFGPIVVPGIALGAFAANITANEPAGTAAVIALGNTLEAVAGAWMLERAGFLPTFERMRDVLMLVVYAAAASTTISATVGVLSLCATGVQPWASFSVLWTEWWIGDAMGDLIIAPLILVWASNPPRGWRVAHSLEGVALLAGLIGMSFAVFAEPFGPHVAERLLPYQIFPFVVWGALRFRQIGTTTMTFIAAALATWGTLGSQGPFALANIHESLVMLQLFQAVVSITGLLLAAALCERDAAQSRLHARAHELADADRRKDEFLAMLAHELRNPLAPLSNALHLLRMPADRERFLAMAERQVALLARLVDDLLDVSRITQGKIELRKERILLADVVAQALDTVRPEIDARAQALTVSLPPQALAVEADPARLGQVFANLLSNAAKYTPSGGSIWLTAEPLADEIVVRVRDTGVGLAPELMPHVFDLFVQADVSLERTRGGLGIGLTVVKRLVEMHGGRVEARSAGIGHGSEFIVHLPHARGAAQDQDTRTTHVQSRARSLKVLIVEDNKDSAETLAEILRLWGHEVRTAFDGSSALEAAERFEPDVIVSDIGLPGMSGFDLARQLRKHPAFGRVVLVAMSGYGQEEDKKAAVEAGFDHHLVKPPDLAALGDLFGRVAESIAERRVVH
jgi:signal transduction histidine kinase/CheY-like chemotaxis protein